MSVLKKILIFCFIAFNVSCKDELAKCNIDFYDRSTMLENWADNIIVPSYELYISKLVDLEISKNIFNSNPNQENLENLRQNWINTYVVWQNISIYEIGRAEIIRLRDYSNSYPLDVEKIESNINSGKYVISNSTNIFAQGFPAIDYLINGVGTSDEDILKKYMNDPNSIGYKKYLSDVIERLLLMGNEVLNDWKTYYRDVFISNSCSSSTASVDKLTNDLIFNLEKVTRKAKIGDPIDFFGEPPVVAPEKIEALYKQTISKELLIASLEAAQNLFNGKHLGSETIGPGLKSYLDELQIEAGGRMLSDVINERFIKAISESESLDNNFYLGIQNDREKYRITRNKIHGIIEVMKTNMISALGIKADYNDSDGD